MDLRGYGNIMGDEQSGHIKEVGIELYQQMLNEAVSNIRLAKEEDVDSDWSPILNIGISVQIPESYVQDISLRLSLYRKIANLESEEQLESLAIEITDRFGKLPEEASHLFSIVKLKQLAKKANVEKIDMGEKGMVVSFRGKQPANIDRVLDLVASNPTRMKLRPENKIFIERSWDNSNPSVLRFVDSILNRLL
jgi:transcription-repair coupling factor (superfamily II helicase)